MWICTSEAFVSAVQDRNRPEWLCVRARMAAHLETLFPTQEIISTPDADYAHRVFVPKTEFVAMMKRQVEQIDYTNFKDSVGDPDLRDLYAVLGEPPPVSGAVRSLNFETPITRVGRSSSAAGAVR